MYKEITIIGFVKEIGANWKTPRVCIISQDGLYLVTLKADEDENEPGGSGEDE